MLDRNKVIREFSHISDRLFANKDTYLSYYKEIWAQLVQDTTFLTYVRSLLTTQVPLWQGRLDLITSVDDVCSTYSVLGIDGSQIYPDRHMGVDCFLINTGGCWTWYNDCSQAELFSDPKIFLQGQDIIPGLVSFGDELVDLVREQYELITAVEKSRYYANVVGQEQYLCLFDGGLLFWYLENKQTEVLEYFLQKYITSLEWFYKNRILISGYISYPKSRELANLIRVKLCLSNDLTMLPCFGKITNCPCVLPDDIVDRTIVSWFLPKESRTILFENKTKVVERYPEWLKPYFCYVNVGNEIVRLEFPKWIVEYTGAVDKICSIVLNQAKKGRGYPVVLAEAHEQAVVKTTDRDFFFDLIYRTSVQYSRPFSMSQKIIKKRNMSI